MHFGMFLLGFLLRKEARNLWKWKKINEPGSALFCSKSCKSKAELYVSYKVVVENIKRLSIIIRSFAKSNLKCNLISNCRKISLHCIKNINSWNLVPSVKKALKPTSFRFLVSTSTFSCSLVIEKKFHYKCATSLNSLVWLFIYKTPPPPPFGPTQFGIVLAANFDKLSCFFPLKTTKLCDPWRSEKTLINAIMTETNVIINR